MGILKDWANSDKSSLINIKDMSREELIEAGFHEKFTYNKPREATTKKVTITYMRFWLGHIDGLKKFCGTKLFYDENKKCWAVVTMEGNFYNLAENHILIKGTRGEIYPCDIEVFNDKYNEVDA